MFDQKIYNLNLAKLALINQFLTDSISSVELPKTPPIHSAREEIDAWFQRLQLDRVAVVYIYGIGSGDAYEVMQPWLKFNSSHYLVFLVDDLPAFKYLLGTPQGSPLLDDIQVDIRDVTKALSERSVIRLITEDNMLRPAAITAIPPYLESESSNFTILKDLIIFESAEQRILFEELSHFGTGFYRNFYTNLLRLPDAYDGKKLLNRFKNIPAIICGAGPSLIKDIDLLKKYHNHALLFAPSSSLNILTSHGVWPHFGVALDPTSETYHRQYMQRGFETPIFYQNRIYSEALSAIQGPKLFFPDDTYYLIEDWFLTQLNLSSDAFEGGYSSVHTALLIAQHLGCNPILFVGLELSKSSSDHYPTGVERHPLFPVTLNEKPELGQPIRVKDLRGQEVTSYWQWIAEADWIDKFQRLNPHLTLLNATDAGIGLFSIPNQTLEEAARIHFDKSYELEFNVHQAIQDAGLLPVTYSQVKDTLELFFQSLQRCLELCKMISTSFSQPQSQDNERVKKQLKKEVGYQYLLIQMEEFYIKLTQKERRIIQRLTDDSDKENKQRQLDQSTNQFLIQTLEIQIQLVAQVLNRTQTCSAVENPPTKPPSWIKQTDERIKIYYYPNGSIYSVMSFDKGLRHGTHLYYNFGGNLRSEINYFKGQLNGFTRLYYPSGQLQREMQFKNGLRDGLEKSWYENGQKFTEINYSNNISKQAKVWHSNGDLAKEIQ